jgi:hypothetical protein
LAAEVTTRCTLRLILFAASLSGVLSPALDAADEKTLDLTRKEGSVSFYTTMAATESKFLADAFQVKYPFLKLAISQLGSEKLLQPY